MIYFLSDIIYASEHVTAWVSHSSAPRCLKFSLSFQTSCSKPTFSWTSQVIFSRNTKEALVIITPGICTADRQGKGLYNWAEKRRANSKQFNDTQTMTAKQRKEKRNTGNWTANMKARSNQWLMMIQATKLNLSFDSERHLSKWAPKPKARLKLDKTVSTLTQQQAFSKSSF